MQRLSRQFARPANLRVSSNGDRLALLWIGGSRTRMSSRYCRTSSLASLTRLNRQVVLFDQIGIVGKFFQ